MTTLWHYTCSHGRAALGPFGFLAPTRVHAPESLAKYPTRWLWLSDQIWLTDLDEPDVHALGLTRTTIRCDRTRHRYRALDLADATPYAEANVPRHIRRSLDAAAGARPEHWWMATLAVPVRYDPRVAA